LPPRAEGFIFSRLRCSTRSHVINARRKGEKWFSALSGELLLIFAPDQLGDFEHSASNYSRNLISAAERFERASNNALKALYNQSKLEKNGVRITIHNNSFSARPAR